MTRQSTTTESESEAKTSPETVLVKSGTGKRVFHTSEECTFCPDDPSHWDQDAALEWGMRPCTWCADDGNELGGDQGGRRKDLYNRLVEIGESTTADD